MTNWTYIRNDRVIVDINPVVFIISSLLIFGFVAASFIFLGPISEYVNEAQSWIANETGWFFVLATNLILAFLVYLFFSRFADIRLGGQDAVADFSHTAWFTMLFSAGMGIGLLFYSVAEPMYHFLAPPHGAMAGSEQAAEDAIRTTFLHWGLHAWGIYTLVGLALAYFAFNRGLPLSIRSIFFPLLGERIYGGWGHFIDILATVATMFGVATSLGLGARQINAGLHYVFGVSSNSYEIQLIIIAIVTMIATASVVAGLHHGIKRLSELNVIVAILLVLFVMFCGPTLFILNGFVENIGQYLDRFFYLAFWNETYTGGSWQNGWTVFYWGWWIAWSPFVGLFIARISRGRTIREFIVGVLFVPTLVTFFWLSVFGDSALYIELFKGGHIAEVVQKNVAESLFVFLHTLPAASGIALPNILISAVSMLAIIVVVTFFVTSSDSGSLVIDMITAGGNPNPPVPQRVFWAVTEGVVAAALLIDGGLTALQTAAISTGLPFTVILIVMMVSLQRGLSADHSAMQQC